PTHRRHLCLLFLQPSASTPDHHSFPTRRSSDLKSEGISLVRSMNVHDWEFRDKNLAFIDEKQAKELDGVTLQENDVLLNITGASDRKSRLNSSHVKISYAVFCLIKKTNAVSVTL